MRKNKRRIPRRKNLPIPYKTGDKWTSSIWPCPKCGKKTVSLTTQNVRNTQLKRITASCGNKKCKYKDVVEIWSPYSVPHKQRHPDYFSIVFDRFSRV